jgi:8-oxo-dGTP pyrophosphatase MutT (NUDIX family)
LALNQVIDANLTIVVPEGARAASRVLVLDRNDRLLYLQAREGQTKREFWVMPGGGLEQGETFVDAAIREVMEETGLEIDLGPCVWTRHHLYQWEGRNHNQFEAYFVARTNSTEVQAPKPDNYIHGHRWWSQDQLRQSDAGFAPAAIATLLVPILAGEFPEVPFDCGI